MSNLCSRCIFSKFYDYVNLKDIYHCLLLETVQGDDGIILCNPNNQELDCPYFCARVRTIDVFVKVHKKQFKKVDLSQLLDRVSISPEDL